MAAPKNSAPPTEDENDLHYSSGEEDGGEQFIDESDVLEEIDDDGDHPMGADDDDEQEDAVPELGGTSSSTTNDETPAPSNSVQQFTGHTSSVFAIATHPTAPLAASGGEDDLGYIWDITDGEIIAKLTGHTDSVAATAFSSDGELIATGGMDGKVRVWRRVGKEDWRTWEFLTEVVGPDEVMWLRWHPKGPVLLAGSNDSTVWLWQLPSGNTMQVLAGHTGAVQAGEFSPDGKRILTADSDGTLLYWDPRSPSPLFRLSSTDARFHLDGITSLAINPLSTLAVIGGAAGGLRVVNLLKGEVLTALGGHTKGESIEAIQFVDISGGNTGGGSGVVVTGATDGKACVWDLNSMRLRATLQHSDAITALMCPPPPPTPNPTNAPSKTHLIVTGSADRTLRTWDARTGALVREHTGHNGAVLGAALGLGGEVIVSAGDDGVCGVWTTEEVVEA